MCASDSSAGTRILGYYLLCVGLVQLGIVAWGQLHGTNDVGWSRIGLLFPIRLVFDESASRTAYWLSLLWFTGLAILLLRDRKPLKTYVASEAILLPGSALVVFLSRSSMTDLVAQSVFYVFESALPLTWAVRLLWLEHRARRSRPRPIPVSRTKALGMYLSLVSVYQLMYATVFFFRFKLFGGTPWTRRFFPLRPRKIRTHQGPGK